jgi:hypothetical protein
MALLAPEPLGLGDGDARHAHLVQGFLHLVQLERFDDRFDLLHVVVRSLPASVAAGSISVPCAESQAGRGSHVQHLASLPDD